MSTLDLNQTRQIQSALVLSNAATLVSSVIQEIAGNDIANSFNGSKATTSIIQMLSHQRILKKLGNA